MAARHPLFLRCSGMPGSKELVVYQVLHLAAVTRQKRLLTSVTHNCQ